MGTPQASDAGGQDAAAVIRAVAGTGIAGGAGDGGPALSAQLSYPTGLAVDRAGALYAAEHGGHRVRKLTTDGKITTITGTGTAGFGGDGGPAAAARLNKPRDVVVDADGTLYIADAENHRVRKVTPDGTISTAAGTGTAGFSGDGGPATSARLNNPYALLLDSTGVLYIAEWGNNRIRKVTPDGKISTIAGTGTAGYGGDNGPATSAHLRDPYGMTADSAGALYVADASNHRVRKITPDGTITTVAGTGTAGFSGDGGPATSARLDRPYGLAFDSTGTLYISDFKNHRVRKVTPDGTITTVAGTASKGSAGDDGPATSAQMNGPYGLAVDCVDTLYIADHYNNRICKIASARMAGMPESGTVVSWANVRSRLRIGVHRESLKDGALVHQSLAAPRSHQRWRLIAAGQADGEVLYRIENLRSGKVLEVTDAQQTAGAPVAQRAYAGSDAHHQQWRLVPAGPATDIPRVFEIANHQSGLLLHTTTNAPAALEQQDADGDHRGRQWQMLPV
ncbi:MULTISPECIES: RICIN domain-containing protein [unclassified Streptomyces]|uniref:NHL domain-containing protein n=1 Tax=unclassified Streptomyces TaxID=2593676 RepID=UPI0033AD9F83